MLSNIGTLGADAVWGEFLTQVQPSDACAPSTPPTQQIELSMGFPRNHNLHARRCKNCPAQPGELNSNNIDLLDYNVIGDEVTAQSIHFLSRGLCNGKSGINGFTHVWFTATVSKPLF